MLPEIGKKAPAFSALDENGNTIGLNTFSGKKLVLYFYPKDDTPGCTAEACSLRDNYQDLLDKGYAVLGVSPDDSKKHTKFIAKYSLPFSLLADTDQAVCNAYGVWVEKNMYVKKYMGVSRKTFIIDKNGMIRKVIDKVDTKNSSAQVLEILK